MKNINKYLILASLFLTMGCTGNFDDMNTNPQAFTTLAKSDLTSVFKGAENVSLRFVDYQITQGLYSDLYAQYYATNVTYFGTDRYNYVSGWEQSAWGRIYNEVVPRLKTIYNNVDANSGEAALANIVWVYAFHHLADYHGSIPYLGAGEGSAVPYNSTKDIYYDFFDKLTSAVNTLKSLPSGTKIFADGDLCYQGDVSKWIKFANTLRLRLAMRISNVDPSKAKTEAEAAYAAGVFDSNSDNTSYTTSSSDWSFYNQLAMCAAWNEFSMSSTIYSYLKGWSDPRLAIYYQPAAKSGKFASLRNGTPASDLVNERNKGVSNSNVGTKWVSYTGTTTTPHYDAPYDIMCYAEALFLRAEGALNGWSMGGTAKELYEAGIRASMQQWGVSNSNIEGYISSTANPAAPEDYYNSPAVCSNLPVKWGASESVQRQQIGTQKWLALFPNGPEGWAEFRRTGYPTMYPVVESDNSSLPQGKFIQRIQYPTDEYSNDKAELEKGIELIGGSDVESAPLWWAKK